MRSAAAILAMTALALPGCSGGGDTQASDEAVETGAVAPGAEPAGPQPVPPEDTTIAPSPVDTQAPALTTATGAAPPVPADPEAVGEQYPDYVGGEQD